MFVKFHLLQIVSLTSALLSWHTMLRFNLKLMTAYTKLCEREPMAMRPVMSSMLGAYKKTIAQLHKVLLLEGHLRTKGM
jgi:hypothetical protein